MNFDVLHAATNNRYVEGDHIRLVSLGPIALFSMYKLATSSGKHIEEINHAHILCLMYTLITSSRGSDDSSIGFERDRNRRQQDLTNNENQKGKYHVTIMLRDIFGFFEHQEKGTYGLGYKLKLTRNIDNAVLNKSNEINNAKIEILSIGWLVAYCTPRLAKQKLFLKQILKKMATELYYPERSVFMKEVNTQNLWVF